MSDIGDALWSGEKEKDIRKGDRAWFLVYHALRGTIRAFKYSFGAPRRQALFSTVVTKSSGSGDSGSYAEPITFHGRTSCPIADAVPV